MSNVLSKTPSGRKEGDLTDRKRRGMGLWYNRDRTSRRTYETEYTMNTEDLLEWVTEALADDIAVIQSALDDTRAMIDECRAVLDNHSAGL